MGARFWRLGEVKEYLDDTFDHTMVIAEDDPELEKFQALPDTVCNLKVVPAVGCERFAEMVYEHVSDWLMDNPNNRYKNMMGDEYPRVKLLSVEVFEHAGNSAIYEG